MSRPRPADTEHPDGTEPSSGSFGCRAEVAEGEIPDNPLYVPPCDCPRCRPTPATEARRGRADGWLRISGDTRRYRVEGFALGPTGRAVLG